MKIRKAANGTRIIIDFTKKFRRGYVNYKLITAIVKDFTDECIYIRI